jgi:hypothetical protein
VKLSNCALVVSYDLPHLREAIQLRAGGEHGELGAGVLVGGLVEERRNSVPLVPAAGTLDSGLQETEVSAVGSVTSVVGSQDLDGIVDRGDLLVADLGALGPLLGLFFGGCFVFFLGEVVSAELAWQWK